MANAFGIDKEYNKEEIFEVLNNLKISQEGENVITKYQGRLISNVAVSKKYEVFNFSEFAKQVVSKIETYFKPRKYKLSIKGGRQELRLIGEDVMINDDIFHKMFNIVNSTDRTRALSLNVGLMRLICSNGMVVPCGEEFESVNVKHYTSSLPDKVEKFVEGLGDFGLTITKQTEAINALIGKTVSYKDIVKKIAFNKDGIVKSTNVTRMNAFAKKIQNSETDAISGLTDKQIKLLNNTSFMVSDTELFDIVEGDIEMDAYQALNLYTEIYRELDSSVLKRETKRIMDILN